MDDSAALARRGSQEGRVSSNPADRNAEQVALRKIPDCVDRADAPDASASEGIERRKHAEEGKVDKRQRRHAGVAEMQQGKDQGIQKHSRPCGAISLHGCHEKSSAEDLLTHALDEVSQKVKQEHSVGGGRGEGQGYVPRDHAYAHGKPEHGKSDTEACGVFCHSAFFDKAHGKETALFDAAAVNEAHRDRADRGIQPRGHEMRHRLGDSVRDGRCVQDGEIL